MLLSADVKSLEVVVCAYLSRDSVLCDEVRRQVPFHDENKLRFKLPDKVTAKRFMFKLIYGASAYGYSTDGDFTGVGYSQGRWQEVIDEFYSKYRGVKQWHTGLVRDAIALGVFKSQTGREYRYPVQDVAKREWFWRPKILNYPVQGLGADLVMLARVSLWRRLSQIPERKYILPVSSVHDSVVLDMPEELVYTIGKVLESCINDVPRNFERCFGVPFDLPLNAELKVGRSLGQMEVITTENKCK